MSERPEVVWLVHGAGASPLSFSYFRPAFEAAFDVGAFEYSSEEGVLAAAARLSEQIEKEQRPVAIVGHSLGGLVAGALTASPLVRKIVTMSTPFGGLSYASVLSLWRSETIFKDLSVYGNTLGLVRNTLDAHRKPHLAVVTTYGGLPLLSGENNDGVVTEATQMALDDATIMSVRCNHFEVLLAPSVRDAIIEFLN